MKVIQLIKMVIVSGINATKNVWRGFWNFITGNMKEEVVDHHGAAGDIENPGFFACRWVPARTRTPDKPGDYLAKDLRLQTVVVRVDGTEDAEKMVYQFGVLYWLEGVKDLKKVTP